MKLFLILLSSYLLLACSVQVNEKEDDTSQNINQTNDVTQPTTTDEGDPNSLEPSEPISPTPIVGFPEPIVPPEPIINHENVRLTWTAPVEDVEDSPLNRLEIDSYLIYWGEAEDDMSNVVEIENPAVTTYEFEDMPTGQYYFSIKVKSIYNEVSDISNIVSKVIE